ncbi:MAG: LysM peptidoglycan-binding domain-containing protein [Fuerstiella sp.]
MAGHHEESGRSDSRGDQVESKKSVDKVASSKAAANIKSDSAKDDDWGYEPKKAGMAIEAKMGMCIVVILLSAFGFLVYRKFDARQRDLLQANLQAAEQALPGSTGGEFVGDFSEFQQSDHFPAQDASNTAATEPLPGANVDLQDLDSSVSFGSRFALQDEPAVETAEPDDSGIMLADTGQGNPFDENPFSDRPQQDMPSSIQQFAPATDTEAVDEFANLALANDSINSPLAGQMASPLDEFPEQGIAREQAGQQAPEKNKSAGDSAFAAFGDPQQAAATSEVGPEFGGASQNEFDSADADPFSSEQQVVENRAPSFDGFPAGFEPEMEGFPIDEKAPEAASSAGAWAKTNATKSSGQLEEFQVEPFDTEFNHSDAGQATASAIAPASNPVPEFAEFDSFANGSEETSVAAQSFDSNKVDGASETSSKQDLPGKTNEPDFNQPSEFADFALPKDSPLSDFENSMQTLPSADHAATDSSVIADSSPSAFPPGFDQSFDSVVEPSEVVTEVSRPSLSPFADPENELNSAASVNSQRRPSIDPSAVIDPLSNVESPPIRLAQADFPKTTQPWDTNGGTLPSESDGTSFVSRSNPSGQSSVPLPPQSDAMDQGLVNSFSTDANFQEPQFLSREDTTATPVEELKMPAMSNVQRANASTGRTERIQQVSATRDPDGIYTVKPDDTYWTISKHAYGTARFFSSLALYNKNRIKDPRKLRQGMKVVIPDPKVLIERYPELLQDYIPKKTMPSGYFLKPDGMPAYRIGERETLSEISQKHLGRASRWVQLYRMNQHVLKNPNRLKPGTVIDLPDDATNVHMVP